MPVVNTYLPPKDQDLLAWSTNFSTRITATPTAFGLVAGQATAYATLHSNFATQLALAMAVATRTKSTVAAKNAAKALLLANARLLAAIVQATPTVTNGQKNDLQLTVRDRHPTPIVAPTTAPIITPLNSSGGNIFFRLADELTPASRSKPAGVLSMGLFVKVGTTPPAGIGDCVFAGLYTKNTFGPGSRSARISFDPSDTGKTAYMLARWYNRRGDHGPESALAQMTVAA